MWRTRSNIRQGELFPTHLTAVTRILRKFARRTQRLATRQANTRLRTSIERGPEAERYPTFGSLKRKTNCAAGTATPRTNNAWVKVLEALGARCQA